MKKTKKNEKTNKNGGHIEISKQEFQAPVHTPSQKTVEDATNYVEDRFGRALVRLSDR